MRNNKPNKVTVVGAGLAGSEAAWQLAQRGVYVDLFEMRPKVTTPAHVTGNYAELVCSNSLGGDSGLSPAASLKEENAPIWFAYFTGRGSFSGTGRIGSGGRPGAI